MNFAEYNYVICFRKILRFFPGKLFQFYSLQLISISKQLYIIGATNRTVYYSAGLNEAEVLQQVGFENRVLYNGQLLAMSATIVLVAAPTKF